MSGGVGEWWSATPSYPILQHSLGNIGILEFGRDEHLEAVLSQDMIGCFCLESQMLPSNCKFDRTGIGSDSEARESTNTAFSL